MRGLILSALALTLALSFSACSPPTRDKRVPITSIAVFDPARFAGRWHVVAALPGWACAPSTLDYAVAGEGLAVTADCVGGPLRGAARMSGPGRMAVTLDGATLEHWVLWVDDGYRTAVLGTPSGQLGLVLNRDPAIPSDRLRAAREILEWNGYDLKKLQMVRQ